MAMRCPNCNSNLSPWNVSGEFHCARCGATMRAPVFRAFLWSLAVPGVLGLLLMLISDAWWPLFLVGLFVQLVGPFVMWPICASRLDLSLVKPA